MAIPWSEPAVTYRDAVIDLLGLVACGELMAFTRLAADAALAPTLEDEVALAGMATAEFGHFERVRDRLAGMGADPQAAMAPFRGPLESFHERTAPRDWWEGLVKAYVGDGIARDFAREIARSLDPQTRALVMEVCDDPGQADFVVSRVAGAVAEDPRISGRLALWGRRLVGEAVSQAQRVAGEREALAMLLIGAVSPEGAEANGADLAEVGRLLGRLTDAHSRRMQSLELGA